MPEFLPGTPIFERPWRTDPKKFSFVIFGDKTGGFDLNWPVFDRAVEEVNRLRPDFVIMVGDLIQGYTEDSAQVAAQWTEFRRHADRLEVPFLFLPGNHDVAHPVTMRWWKRHIGRTYYNFTYLGCHFLVLNTEEAMGEQGKVFGDEQMQFALAALDAHRDARHTFIFMHKPMWPRSNDEWERIEHALGTRPYAVFAGHRHTLQYLVRDGRRYLVLGPTGAQLNPSEVKQLGRFHHYTHVTVDGDSAYLAIVEPGNVWREDIAPADFAERANPFRMMRVKPIPVQELGGGRVSVGVEINFANALPESVAFVFRPVFEPNSSWRFEAGADSVVVRLAPGTEARRSISFVGRADNRLPPPYLVSSARMKDAVLYRSDPWFLTPYPQESMVVAPEWETMGPFDIGPLAAEHLPDNPRLGIPRMFEPRKPDSGWVAGTTYEENGRTFSWRTASADSEGIVNFNEVMGARDFLLGYATCAVCSPVNQRIAARIRADNFMQFFVNGKLAGELFESPSTYKLVPVDLKTGWNTLMVKLVNARGDWYFQCHLFDPSGNLRFAPHRMEN